MKGRFSVFIMFFLLVSTAETQNPQGDKYANEDISSFMPKGYALRQVESSDLNQDGLQDKLLVLESDPQVDTTFLESDGDSAAVKHIYSISKVTSRSVIILIRQKNGRLKQYLRNDDALPGSEENPMAHMSSAFLGVTVQGSTFSYSDASHDEMGACQTTKTFKYDKKANDWFLDAIIDSCADANPSGDSYWGPYKETRHRTATDFGKVPFTQYSCSKQYGVRPNLTKK